VYKGNDEQLGEAPIKIQPRTLLVYGGIYDRGDLHDAEKHSQRRKDLIQQAYEQHW